MTTFPPLQGIYHAIKPQMGHHKVHGAGSNDGSHTGARDADRSRGPAPCMYFFIMIFISSLNVYLQAGYVYGHHYHHLHT